MNTWMIRMLGGAACTVGVLAAGATMAQANESHHGLVDVRAVVKLATPHHAKQSVVKVHVGVKAHVGSRAGTSVKARANVRVGSPQHSSTTRRSPAATAPQRSAVDVRAGVRVGSGNRSTSSKPAGTYHRKPVVQVTLKAMPLAKADVRIDSNRPSRVKKSHASTTPSKRLVAAKVEVKATVLRLPVSVCLRLNTSACGTGSGHSTPGGGLIPSVISDTDAVVLDTPVDACIRINAGGCSTGSGHGTTPSNPALPVIGTDVTTTVTDVIDGTVCLRINGGTCGTDTTPTDPTDPTDPNTPVTPVTPVNPVNPGGGNNGGGHNGGDSTTLITPISPLQNAVPNNGANGNADELAHTGASAGLLGILLAGLLLLITSGGLLRRRRS